MLMRVFPSLGLALLMMVLAGCESEDTTVNAEQDTRDGAVLDSATAPASPDGTAPDASTIPTADSGPAVGSDASTPPGAIRQPFTHKMIKGTGENPFASLAYECPECTFAQWESIETPPGWTKGPAQVSLFSAQHSLMRSHPSVEGHPAAVDFLDEVPGDEYKVIAITRSGRLVERGPAGFVAEVQVQRDTRLVFTAGMRVHELTDPEGNVFVLFVHHFDMDDWRDVDYQSADALDYLTAPEGWTYSNRILDEELALDSNNSDGVATVLAIRGAINSSWEKR